ncbi:MAG: histidine kinase [Vitreoscilla sp.]|nr:histidine kinase [Vitreoscilla sp.]
MTSWASRAALHPEPGGALRQLYAAWRSLHWRELAAFATLGLLYGVVDLSALSELKHAEQTWPLFWRLLLSPVICSLVLMLAWLPADRSPVQAPHRSAALIWATVLGSAAAAGVMWSLTAAGLWPSWADLCAPKCKAPPPAVLLLVSDFLGVLLPGAMAIGVVELWRRRRHAEMALQGALHEHDALARRAMAARLAAVQAQVEPHFLFDVLVDIEQQYAGAAPAGAADQLDRLIAHLRVALPRLRENNVTTLDAEATLLGSYLALWQGLHGESIAYRTDWASGLGSRQMPAMLLLPLLQRALRLATPCPSAMALRAEALPGGLRVALMIAQTGLCGDDVELDAQRERLRVLAGEGAKLQCESIDGATTFTLELPA